MLATNACTQGVCKRIGAGTSTLALPSFTQFSGSAAAAQRETIATAQRSVARMSSLVGWQVEVMIMKTYGMVW